MKLYFRLLQLILLFAFLSFLSCRKETSSSDSVKNKKTFNDSVWVFTPSVDTIIDKLLGKWLSKEVRYKDTLCQDCDSLFTWVIESNGIMVERNNDFGDNETQYGTWELNDNKKFILFKYETSPVHGDFKASSMTITDSIKIDYSSKAELCTCESNSFGKPKMNIKFIKMNK